MNHQLIQYLSYLKEKKLGPIFILGHDQCDVDSFISGCLLEKLGQHLGLSTRFICLDNMVDYDTSRIVSDLGLSIKEHFATESEKQSLKEGAFVILVDHHQNQWVDDSQVIEEVIRKEILKTIENKLKSTNLELVHNYD